MRVTGIIRRIDDLGRIVIPREIRQHLRIHEGDPLEIFINNDTIILKKYKLEETFIESIKGLMTDIKEELYDNEPDKINKVLELLKDVNELLEKK